jgi:hypothetical protein
MSENAPVSRSSAWPIGLSLLAALALVALAFNVWQSKQSLSARLSLAEDETRLLRAELRSAQNQLAAERLLAFAQARQWRAAEAELARLRAELDQTRSGSATLPASPSP